MALAALGLDWSPNHMNAFREQARALVVRERRAITVLAAELVQRRMMTGDEISVVLSDARRSEPLWVT